MEKRENNILKCRYITPIEWEQINGSEEQYFENGVKITTNGESTYCCSETIIKSLAKRLNEGIVPKAYKNIINAGKTIEYIFVYEEEGRIIKINIPTSLTKDVEKYPFIRSDVRQYDKICKLSQEIRTSKNVKEVCKKTAAALLSAATLVISYVGTRKVIEHLSQPAPSTEHLTYNLYYGNIMSEEDFNANVQRMYESHKRIEAEQARKEELKKQKKLEKTRK